MNWEITRTEQPMDWKNIGTAQDMDLGERRDWGTRRLRERESRHVIPPNVKRFLFRVVLAMSKDLRPVIHANSPV